MRSGFRSGILASRLSGPARAPGGRVETTIDEALEAAETPAAPGLLPDSHSRSETLAPQPMTQRRVLSLATPIIGENLLQTLVGAVDTFMVARLGAAAVAGVGTGFEIVFFIISILSAIDIGATVLVSQAIGAGDQRRANQLARQAIVWGLVLAIPVSVGMYLAAPAIIGLFGTEPDVAEAATTYLQIIAATSVALFLSFVCGAVLRGAGDSRTPLAAAVLANIVNIVGRLHPDLRQFRLSRRSVSPAARFGAAAGRGLGAAYMLLAMARGKKAISLRGSWGWRPQVATARQLFTLGVPAAVEQMLSSGAFMVLLAVVALIGTPALAAQQIAFTALSTAFLPGIAFSITATALVGQSIGARLPSDARKAWAISLRWAIAWLGIGGVLVFIFSEQLMRIFSSDPEVICVGRQRVARAQLRSSVLGGLVRQQRQPARQRRYAHAAHRRRIDDVAFRSSSPGSACAGSTPAWAGSGPASS